MKMEAIEMKNCIDDIKSYMLDVLSKKNASVNDCMNILTSLVDVMIRSITLMTGMDDIKLRKEFCSALMYLSKSKDIFATGSQKGDMALSNIINNANTLEEIEKMVDEAMPHATEAFRNEIKLSLLHCLEEKKKKEEETINE